MTIETLRQLDAEATPGPWRAWSHEASATIGEDFGDVIGPKTVAVDRVRMLAPADATLIAAMRNALPALLDIAEAARHVLKDPDLGIEKYDAETIRDALRHLESATATTAPAGRE